VLALLRYEFNPYILTNQSFIGPVWEFNAPNSRSLLGGFEETIPDDIHLTYNNTIVDDECDPLETVFEHQYTTLVSFFALQLIDIPLCFRKTKSLYSLTAATPKLRLLNMLMRHGKKAKMASAYALALHSIAATSSTKTSPSSKSPS
jgi:hypothetical protein